MTDVPPCPSTPLLTTTSAFLLDAQTAYHKLITGTAVVRFKDANGEEVEYNLASATKLLEYIKTLQDVLTPNRRINGPMGVYF